MRRKTPKTRITTNGDKYRLQIKKWFAWCNFINGETHSPLIPGEPIEFNTRQEAIEAKAGIDHRLSPKQNTWVTV